MGRDSDSGHGGPANDLPSVRFGWRPDIPSTEADHDVAGVSPRPADPEVAPPSDSQTDSLRHLNGKTNDRTRDREKASPSGHANGHSNGNGASVSPQEFVDPNSTSVVDLRLGQAPTIQELQPYRLEQQGSSSTTSVDDRKVGIPKILLHAFVVVTIVAVVVGHGYWHEIPQSIPQQTAANRNLRLGELPVIDLPNASTVSYTLASVGGATQDGYVSQFSTAIIPERLNIKTIQTTAGQSIADIAKQTGRSIDTLLWANSMQDPAKPLPPGTEIRVPPVDGMLHIVHDGDTLASIAARYQVDVSAITSYAPNNVQSTSDLVPYRMIMVPGGKMPTRDHVVTYVVQQGDSLGTIAQYFGLHPDTIVWANSLKDGNLIFPGQNLAILPTDGVMVTVTSSDTVDSLAKTYGVTAKDIVDYPLNGLGGGGKLRVGQQVMIPGGEPPPPPPPPPTPVPAPVVQQASAAPARSKPAAAAPAASTGFIWPTNGTITQYFGPTSLWMEPPYEGYAHFHQGIDIANAAYTPIVAAAAGTVVFAGWNAYGYGYAVSINHGNGLVTWYGHMAKQPSVWVGERVSQGQYLGPMGSTGASTGDHCHFGVLLNGVWVNPLKYLP